MKKYYSIIIFIFIFFNLNSQNLNILFNTYRFYNKSDSCNFFILKDNDWHVSNGSPFLIKNNQGNYNACFEGKHRFSEQSEGIFTKYNFECGHSYSVSIIISSTYTNGEKFQVCAANKLVQKNDKCNLGTIPSKPDTCVILNIKDLNIYTNDLTITIDSFVPKKNFSQLWLLSRSAAFGSEFYVSSISIYDNGKWDTQKPEKPRIKSFSLYKTFWNFYTVNVSWDKAVDNCCIKGYYFDDYSFTHRTDTTLNNIWIRPCTNYSVKVEAVDGAENISDPSIQYTKTPPTGKTFILLDKDFSKTSKVKKEATQAISFRSGFKYYPKKADSYFTASLIECPCTKDEQNIDTDTLKTKEPVKPKATIKYSNNINSVFKICPDDEKDFKICPNPSSGIIKIFTSDLNEYQINIYTTSGKLIYSNLLNSQLSIDLSDLETSIYFLKAISNDKIINKKIILEK